MAESRVNKKLVIFRDGEEMWHINKASEYLGISTQALKLRIKKEKVSAFQFSGLLSGNPYYFLAREIKLCGGKYIRKRRLI